MNRFLFNNFAIDKALSGKYKIYKSTSHKIYIRFWMIERKLIKTREKIHKSNKKTNTQSQQIFARKITEIIYNIDIISFAGIGKDEIIKRIVQQKSIYNVSTNNFPLYIEIDWMIHFNVRKLDEGAIFLYCFFCAKNPGSCAECFQAVLSKVDVLTHVPQISQMQ